MFLLLHRNIAYGSLFLILPWEREFFVRSFDPVGHGVICGSVVVPGVSGFVLCFLVFRKYYVVEFFSGLLGHGIADVLVLCVAVLVGLHGNEWAVLAFHYGYVVDHEGVVQVDLGVGK